MVFNTANGRVNGERMNHVGYIDLIGPGEVEYKFSIDKLRINFLKHPLKSLRRSGTKFFHKHSKIGKETIENPGSWRVLDLLYGNEIEIHANGDYEFSEREFVPKHWTDKIFYNSKASEATRARFKHYVETMKQLGEEYAESNNGRVNILSLASGPGRDVMEVAESLKRRGIDVYATCVDKDKGAMEIGSIIAMKKGLKGITFKRCKIGKAHHYENGNFYDIVITQGIMDYLNDERGVDLLKNARNVSKEGGTVITSNMDVHRWMRFFMEVFGGWKLKYRNGKELEKIMINAGYEKDKVNVYLLPEGYHWIGMGKK